MAPATPSFGRYRILVVDDHPIVRLGIAQTLARQSDLEICGEAASIQDALRLLEQTPADLVVVDLTLDGGSGMKLIEEIKTRWPAVKTLVSSAHDERVYAGRVLRAGASGYISKREAGEKIVDAVRHVLSGQIYLSPAMTSRLLQRASIGEPLNADPVETLSNRELQVFEKIGRGQTSSQIAHELGVSPKTVDWYRKMIKEKLRLPNASQLSRTAILWVQENG